MWPAWYRPVAGRMFADDLMALVAKRFKTTPEEIRGRARGRYITNARWALIAGLRSKGLSTITIGRLVHRDHTSVLHALTALPDRCSRDAHLARAVTEIRIAARRHL